jgi:hypothetical protein
MSDHATNVGRVIGAVGDIVAGILTAGAYLGHLPEIAAGMAVCWYLYSFGRAIIGWARYWLIKSNANDHD